MVTDIFFDLQRFADEPSLIATATSNKDTLVGDGEKFTWQGGHSFAGGAGTSRGSAVYMAAAGTSGAVAQVAGTKVYLTGGTEEGYTFAIDEVKNDWEVDIKGDNIIAGDFSDGNGSYELYGNADITVLQGSTEGFTETVNGASTYLKAGNQTTFNLAADGTALTYTFADGVSDIDVGLDADDTAVFQGAADFTARPKASAEGVAVPLAMTNAATITSNGSEDITISSGDNTFTNSEGEQIAIKANGTATFTSNSIAGASGVTLTTKDGFTEAFTINGTKWDQISGSMSAIEFNADGNAMVIGNGKVTAKGADESRIGFAKINQDGVVVNEATIKAYATDVDTTAVEIEGTGIKSIALDNADEYVRVAGDNSFKVVNGGQSYSIATSADEIIFDGDQTVASLIISKDESYTVEDVNANYTFNSTLKADSTASVTINSAVVEVTSGVTNDSLNITSSANRAGIDGIYNIVANDTVDVSGDSDGYIAVFNKEEGIKLETVALTASGLRIDLPSSYMNANDVSFNVAASGTEATVTGIEANAIIVLEGGENGATYHIKNSDASNTVFVAAGTNQNVTLDGNGNVADVMDDDTKARLQNDEDKWDKVAYAGSFADTLTTNHGKVYETFYALKDSGVAAQSVAGYSYDDDTSPTNTSNVINITGDKALGSAAHLTLEVGSGAAYVGEVPINIQQNENDNVVDVKLDLTKSNNPSTVAVGTYGKVTAAHNVLLSNAGSSADPNYGYIGEFATGSNLLQAGNGAAMLRHDGSYRSSIFGGSGNDTILAGGNDVVKGGTGADLFYDSAAYGIDDYSASEGDAIIATRLSSIDEVDLSHISGTGNTIKLGDGKALAINKDGNSALHVKVAVMDQDANVLPARRDVVLANDNGLVDATAAGSNGALIVADSRRGVQGVHSVVGSAGADNIYIGSNDYASGGAGDDYITIEEGASGAVVGFAVGDGKDTVAGWQFGFDKNAGNSQLNLGGANFSASIEEDQVVVSLSGGNSVTFADTTNSTGPFNMIIDDKNYTVLRSGGSAMVDSNDALADIYYAQADGAVTFTSNVNKNLGTINLTSTEFQNIKQLYLFNNSQASVYGSSERETVGLDGVASVGSGRAVSLGAENDVIYSSGDNGAGNVFYFSRGDGRDTIQAFGHYRGVNVDPGKQMADLLVIDNFLGVDVATSDGYDRVVFKTSDQDDVVIYESTPLDYNNNMYQVKIDGNEKAIAKIGYSDGRGNNFTYNDEVKYYVGSSGTANDTLTVGNDIVLPEIWLDSAHDGKFYRGISVIDATALTYTEEASLVGSMDNNTIYGGGVGSTTHMWGGAGNNLLVGGEGADTFMYYQYSRNYIDGAANMESANHDVIAGYSFDHDVIYLGDITIDDINFEATSIGADSVTVAINNGGTLTVAGTQERTRFTLSNGDGETGEVWVAERSSGTWTRES